MIRLKDYLSSLFNSFEDAGINYCILRNYQTLPYELRSGDVDLLVLEKQKKRAEEILSENHLAFNSYFEKISRLQYVYSFWIAEKQSIHNTFSKQFNIKIDFFFNEEWFGAKIITGEEILQNKRRYRNFFIPDPVFESIVLLIDSIIYKKYIKEKYKQIILSNFRQNKLNISVKLINVLGENLGKNIISNLENNSLDNTLKYEKNIKRKVFKDELLKHNMVFLTRLCKFLIYELKSRVKN